MADLDAVFNTLTENLQMVIDQLKNDSNVKDDPDETFDSKEFWKNADKVIKVISHEATKICLAFSGSPIPSAQEIRPLVEGIERGSLSCVSLLYSLPAHTGTTLRKSFRRSLVQTIIALKSLLSTIKDNNYTGSQSQLQSTGSVWESCEEFPQLPRDNRTAVCKLVREDCGLIKDALEEIQQEVEESKELDGDDSYDDNEDKWSPRDIQQISPAIAIVKASHASLKKSLPAIKRGTASEDTISSINELDAIANRLVEISPAVDDLITVLYPPLELTVVEQNVDILEGKLMNFLEQIKHSHITNEDDEKWLEFLLKAVKHNADKFRELTST